MKTLTTIIAAAGLTACFHMAAAAQTIAIRGGTVHTLVGEPIEAGTVVMQDGRITAVGADVTVPPGADVIDAAGLHVYPGLFDAVSRLGLTEIGQVAVTSDMRELGEFNPQLTAATAVHPASEIIPVTRANGITHTVAVPTPNAGGIGGQGSLIHLDGWTIEEMLIEPSVGMVLQWPTIQTRGFRFGRGRFQRSYREAKEMHDGQVADLKEWMEEAKRYQRATAARTDLPRDLKLEALASVTRRELPMLVTAGSDRDIREAVEFATEQEIDIIIVGGAEAWRVAGLLAEHDIPVILGPTQALPTREDDAYDQRYTTAERLREAGVRFAFATMNASSSRTLPYEAANAVAYGLPREDALKAITIYGAEILGVGDELGTIEEGKIANLIVTDGDPLEITTDVQRLFINGHATSLDNKHKRLYERYRSRPAQRP